MKREHGSQRYNLVGTRRSNETGGGVAYIPGAAIGVGLPSDERAIGVSKLLLKRQERLRILRRTSCRSRTATPQHDRHQQQQRCWPTPSRSRSHHNNSRIIQSVRPPIQLSLKRTLQITRQERKKIKLRQPYVQYAASTMNWNVLRKQNGSLQALLTQHEMRCAAEVMRFEEEEAAGEKELAIY